MKKTRRIKNLLPKLKKNDVNKTHKYHLHYPQKKRVLAIDEGIRQEMRRGKTRKQAATSKKGRLNILRIYRRYKKLGECNKITSDMKYIDKKYNLGKTSKICGVKKGGTKKQFFFNPDNPKKSFDVYIDKNPRDTISIKYKTIDDVKNTILKLENLYKTKKYSHKRIWQVAMIMKVRIGVIKEKVNTKNKTKRYKSDLNKRVKLSEKYLKFLGQRTRQKDNERFKMKFVF
jgi:hypothetical protein